MEELNELYSKDGIYGTFTYGSPFVCKGLKCAAHFVQFPRHKYNNILCVGSGNGYEAVWFKKKGYDTTVVELYHPDIPILKGTQIKGYAQDLPFRHKAFDLCFCCEMMEHVPEELNTPILKEAKRVAKEVFFTIADRDDPPYHTHINIHDFSYWYDLFKELGFTIIKRTDMREPSSMLLRDQSFSQHGEMVRLSMQNVNFIIRRDEQMSWLPVIKEIESLAMMLVFEHKDADITFVLSGTYLNPLLYKG